MERDHIQELEDSGWRCQLSQNRYTDFPQLLSKSHQGFFGRSRQDHSKIYAKIWRNKNSLGLKKNKTGETAHLVWRLCKATIMKAVRRWWKGSHRGEPSVSPNKGAVLEATEQHAGSSLDPKGSAESSLQFLNWEKNKPFFTEHLETFSIVVKIHVINNIYLSHFKVCGLIMLSIFASLYNQSPENLSCKAKTILTEPELLFALTPGSNHGV